MSAITLNGLAFPVARNSLAEHPREVGQNSTAFDGTPRASRQRLVTDIELESTALPFDTAAAWMGLINGLGHVWSFDAHLYSSKGLGPSSSTGASIQASCKFGSGLRLTNGGSVTYGASLGSTWTVGLWRYSSGWSHYLVRSDGAKWLNGARADGTSTPFIEVASGAVTISNTSGGAVDFDDLVALPFLAPTDWPPVLGVASSAFSALPRLTLAGSLVAAPSSRVVTGTCASRVIRVSDGNRRLLSVALAEV